MPSGFRDLLLLPFDSIPLAMGVCGAIGGLLAALLTRRALAACGEPAAGGPLRYGVLGALLSAAFTWAMLRWHCQETPMVRPDAVWWYWRIGHHVVLIALMLAVTATDLRAYLIPDGVTLTGLAWGIALATLSGDLQIEHLWCDWNQEVPQIAGAYIPPWIAAHPHLHGFAWSAAGAAFGAAAVWLIRAVSSAVLGKETMGLGDVTLMGMIGSFLGWQPVVIVLLLAPLCALSWHVVYSAVRLPARLWSRAGGGAGGPPPDQSAAGPAGRKFVPYGPYLCLASGVVLFTWRWIWMFELRLGQAAQGDDRIHTVAVRRLFGDGLLLAGLGAAMLAALVLLLALRRAYLAIPVTRRRAAPARSADAPDTDGPTAGGSTGD